jgi:hypothetical protein
MPSAHMTYVPPLWHPMLPAESIARAFERNPQSILVRDLAARFSLVIAMPYVWDAHGTLREAFSLYNCRPLSSRAACFGTRKARVMCERWRVIVPDSVKLTLIKERCARCAVESSKGSTPCDINIFLRRSCPFHRRGPEVLLEGT